MLRFGLTTHNEIILIVERDRTIVGVMFLLVFGVFVICVPIVFTNLTPVSDER